MNIVRGPRVAQVRIYPQDAIPIKQYAIQTYVENIKNKFSFTNVQIPFPLHDMSTPNIVEFINGNIIISKSSILIYRISLDDRRIIIDAEASSDKIDMIYNIVEKEIINIDNTGYFKTTKCLLKVDETSCTVHLNINYGQILSKQIRDFLKDDVSKYSMFNISNISLKSLSFEISYEQNKDFQKKNISLVPKLLTIEPRTLSAEEDNIFFTSSPFDSNTHMKLLTDLESRFR